ncbi:Protein sleepless [Caenorhabditis elegans]|uniref:Ly-6-related protein ODR-2 isoform 18 n=1 Tax=Caenorhabditis elegans TaxID=6239 RepID=G5EEC7_CAEEL|nr:Protein sleepless [Caenorhabditis elegans]AAK01413.1 Ly-6-related protein ODR-2 isoform 18 [Caenorhabditis elegans]CCD83391.1 Protein sleepless [Caenorhabditis elegans]|eukprot:NP_001024089.1 Uncharacterized protein CELE_T01C4.2 [Caenorhabditis elegans]
MAADVLQIVSYLLANVSDFNSALRLPCYSCMSPYLEDHYPYISHLYRKPLSFDTHCDKHSLETSYLYSKNCSDMCVTLRINDVVGGRRRHGYMRGCLSDLHGYNHSLIRTLAERQGCLDTTARELFLPTAQRQELEPSRLSLCACHNNLCNFSVSPPCFFIFLFVILVIFLMR